MRVKPTVTIFVLFIGTQSHYVAHAVLKCGLPTLAHPTLMLGLQTFTTIPDPNIIIKHKVFSLSSSVFYAKKM